MSKPAADLPTGDSPGKLDARPGARRLEHRIQLPNGRNISCTKPVTLANLLATNPNNGGLAVLTERHRAVMHNRAKIIAADIISIRDMLVEVMAMGVQNVLPDDLNVLVPVFTALFVP